MNPATDLPHKYYLNLDRRTERRERCEAMFADLGWEVIRQSAVDARALKTDGGFENPGRYAHAVSTRMMLRRAGLAGAEAVLILEDDVEFNPAVTERLAALQIPEDWGIFYLGCQHCERPEAVAPGVVRVKAALDTHAWVVRREYFLEVRRAMRGAYWKKEGPLPAADVLLAELAQRIPVYAAYPNLAGQQNEESDLAEQKPGNYRFDFQQQHNRECLAGLLAEVWGGKPHAPAAKAAAGVQAWFRRSPEARHQSVTMVETPPAPLLPGQKVAFLFLTKGPHQHPGMWAEYWRGAEDRVSIYAHSKEPRESANGEGNWLHSAQIEDRIPTQWGDVSLVRAEMALLKAALADGTNSFFIFASETCVPVRPLRTLLQMLSLDPRSWARTIPLEIMDQVSPYKADRAPLEGALPPCDWMFHPQWMLLNREAAELVVANEVLVDFFEGSEAPDEAAIGTILNAAGWPFETKCVSRDITWTYWDHPEAAHPVLFEQIPAAVIGDIIGSGAFFARKFSADSGVERYRLHV